MGLLVHARVLRSQKAEQRILSLQHRLTCWQSSWRWRRSSGSRRWGEKGKAGNCVSGGLWSDKTGTGKRSRKGSHLTPIFWGLSAGREETEKGDIDPVVVWFVLLGEWMAISSLIRLTALLLVPVFQKQSNCSPPSFFVHSSPLLRTSACREKFCTFKFVKC